MWVVNGPNSAILSASADRLAAGLVRLGRGEDLHELVLHGHGGDLVQGEDRSPGPGWPSRRVRGVWRAQGDLDRRQRGRPQDGAPGQFGVDVEHLVEVGFLEAHQPAGSDFLIAAGSANSVLAPARRWPPASALVPGAARAQALLGPAWATDPAAGRQPRPARRGGIHARRQGGGRVRARLVRSRERGVVRGSEAGRVGALWSW